MQSTVPAFAQRRCQDQKPDYIKGCLLYHKVPFTLKLNETSGHI